MGRGGAAQLSWLADWRLEGQGTPSPPPSLPANASQALECPVRAHPHRRRSSAPRAPAPRPARAPMEQGFAQKGVCGEQQIGGKGAGARRSCHGPASSKLKQLKCMPARHNGHPQHTDAATASLPAARGGRAGRPTPPHRPATRPRGRAAARAPPAEADGRRGFWDRNQLAALFT